MTKAQNTSPFSRFGTWQQSAVASRLHRVWKKVPLYFWHLSITYFTKCWPISKIMSLTDSAVVINHACRYTVLQIFKYKNHHAPEVSEANCHVRLKYLIQWLKHSYSDVSIIRATDETLLTVATPIKYRITDYIRYSPAATKKDVATKLLSTRSTFSRSLIASVSESKVVDNQFDTSSSQTQSR